MVIMGSFGTEGNLGNFLSTQGGLKKGTIFFVQLLFETKQIMSFRILL
jgi:hypothetical protein